PSSSSPRMRMYLWNTALPYRDGDLEAGIVIHESSHDMSTRLTGGSADLGCLGWCDRERWYGSSEGDTKFRMGAWAANRTEGIQNFIYSTDNTTNPSIYKTLDKPLGVFVLLT
ncbi:Peptidase M36, partial [Amanita muscaria]